MKKKTQSGFMCSWCGRSESETQIVAGPCVYICRECHGLVGDIFAAYDEDKPEEVTK